MGMDGSVGLSNWVDQWVCFKCNKIPPTHTMRFLYNSQVFPHLIYAITIWGSSDPRNTYLQPLIRVQKKVVGLVQNVPPRAHTQPIMYKLKILNITNLYILRVCVEAHPFIYPTAQPNRPIHAHEYLFTAQIHEHKTRHATQRHQYIPNPSVLQNERATTHDGYHD